ncbi:hypothetical protein ACJRO7_029519 [Eucalyptus globulus]|uniref:Uncharacterized protein n=1 Tax=Eucalyptus globulus TaxID=34317 RepID=A0ABD3JFV4_EUCGL
MKGKCKVLDRRRRKETCLSHANAKHSSFENRNSQGNCRPALIWRMEMKLMYDQSSLDPGGDGAEAHLAALEVGDVDEVGVARGVPGYECHKRKATVQAALR